MSRTLSEIYEEAKTCRDEYLGLTEVDYSNDSKMSLMDAITYMVAACIWTFESLYNVFVSDITDDLDGRINGTAEYYILALLKYQSGDELVVNDDGTQFYYETVDESKRVVTKASYYYVSEAGFHDKRLVLKCATGEAGAYEKIDDDELTKIEAYINQIAFAGTSISIDSRSGDILLPYLTVYHDGAVTNSEVMDGIREALNTYVEELDFNGIVYSQKIIDAIQSADHVIDVEIPEDGGIYLQMYDADDNLESTATKIDRRIVPNSGYIKESTGSDDEEEVATWDECISLVVESLDDLEVDTEG